MVLVWRFLHRNALLPELAKPGVDIRNRQMNEAADWTIARVLTLEKL